MLVPSLLLAAALAGAPAKASWGEVTRPDVRAEVLPRSAVVEIDGKEVGRGYALVEVGDPKRTLRVRVSAAGFETEEKVVVAGDVADREYVLALRPAGFERRADPADAGSMALAASALAKAGRLDDAADYATQSLRAGNTPLANRVLGDVWRHRGNRDEATRYYAMYLSLAKDPPDAPEIKAYLMQPRPGDISLPAQ
jgi:tetratricopeptide (TPR) repeat protein